MSVRRLPETWGGPNPRPRGLLLIWLGCILASWAVVAVLVFALWKAIGAVL